MGSVNTQMGMLNTLVGRLAICFAAFVLCDSAVSAQDAKPADGAPKITYDEHVKPILREHCLTCHSQDSKKGDLALDNYAGAMAGGASGEVVVSGDLESSRLWALVNHEDEPKMPPMQDKLAAAKLDVLKAWIAGGALENSGSVAKPKKPSIDLGASAGSAQPMGEPVMPSGLSRRPAVFTTRASAVTAIAASPWAPLVAVGGQKQISLYHTGTGKLLGVLPFPEGVPYVLKFGRSGSLLLAGGGHAAKSGRAVVYDVKSGSRVFEVGDELDAVLAADISQDHTRIAIGGPNRIVRVYSAADGSLQHEIRKHTDWIYAVEFSPDGVLLATSDRSGGLFVWESDTAREYQNLQGHKGGVTDVSWRIDSNLLASSSEDGTIKLWEMEAGKEVKNWNAHGGGASAVEFGRDGKLVSVGRDKVAKVWDGNGGQVRAFEAFADLALECALTSDSARVVAGDWNGEVRLLEVADGKLVGHLPANPPTLEMAIETVKAQQAVRKTAAEQAAGELMTAQSALEQATKQVETATTALAAVEEAAKKTADELTAAQAAKAGAADQAAADKLIEERTVAAKTASDAVTAAKAELEKQTAAKAGAQQAVDAKAGPHKLAAEALTAAETELKGLLDELQAAPPQPAANQAASN